MKRILVVGSLNMDIVIETPCMPKAGETIAGKSIAQIPGGKGANQAFAAGKLGGNIAMMGAVGNDEKGEKLLESLKGVGVDISRIEVMNDIPTGAPHSCQASDSVSSSASAEPSHPSLSPDGQNIICNSLFSDLYIVI